MLIVMYKQAVTCMRALGNLSAVAMSYMEGKFNDIMRSDSTVRALIWITMHTEFACTLVPLTAYKEFGYDERPATKSRFLYIKTTDCNVQIFRYNKQTLVMRSFFYILLLVQVVPSVNVLWDGSGLNIGVPVAGWSWNCLSERDGKTKERESNWGS